MINVEEEMPYHYSNMPKGLLLCLFILHTLNLVLAKSENNKHEDNFDKKSKPGQFTCPKCGRSFTTEKSLQQHMTDKKHFADNVERDKVPLNRQNSVKEKEGIKNVADDSSKAKPARQKSLERSESVDRISSTRERRASIDKIEKDNVAIDKYEKRSAVQDYAYYARKIIDYIRTLEGGKIYSADFFKAGSHSVKTKIGKPDEFDINLPVTFDVTHIRTEGKLTYLYEDKNKLDDKLSLPIKMKTDRNLRDISNMPQEIPHGQAVVEIKDQSIIPHLTQNNDVIPHKLLQDLHRKIEAAISDVGLTNVELSPTSQGPALTITIKQPNSDDINVDFVISLPCSKFLSMPALWPRKNTRRVFDQNKLKAVEKVGVHLVPKGGETWTISYSKAEQELLTGIDKGNECRREIMRLMKYYLEICKEKSSDGLPGLSSHIVKTQILWSNENRREPGYWSQKQKDVCLSDVIDDMITSLEKADLPDYFDEKMNVLAHKNKKELQFFSNCLKNEKNLLFGDTIKDEL